MYKKLSKVSFIFSLIAVLLLPFYFLRFSLGPIRTNIFEVFVCFAFLFSFFTSSKKDYFYNSFWIFLLLITIFIGALAAPNQTTALGIWKGWFFIPALTYFLINRFNSQANLKKYLSFLSFDSIVVSVWAILQKLGLIGLLFYQRGDTEFEKYFSEGRYFGPFESPNYLAMFIAPIIFISGYLLWDAKSKIGKLLFGAGLLIQIIALLLTKSEAGYLAVAIGLIILLYVYLRKIKCNFWFAPLAILLYIGLTTLSIISFINLSKPNSDSNTRSEIYRYSIQMLDKNWVNGIGLGNFKNQITSLSISNDSFREFALPYALHPHNFLLNSWLNLGLFGLLFFLIILGILIHQACAVYKKSRLLGSVIISIIGIILIQGIFDTVYFKNDLSAFFWIIFALTNWGSVTDTKNV